MSERAHLTKKEWESQIDHIYSRTPTPAAGRKDDQGKLRYDLIPPEALHALASVLTMGADKYGDHNWRGGMKYSRLVGAMQRHLNAWMLGDIEDTESGYSHMWHVLCNAAFLVSYENMMTVGQLPQEVDDVYYHRKEPNEDDTRTS